MASGFLFAIVAPIITVQPIIYIKHCSTQLGQRDTGTGSSCLKESHMCGLCNIRYTFQMGKQEEPDGHRLNIEQVS
jgi:hypothetical protein